MCIEKETQGCADDEKRRDVATFFFHVLFVCVLRVVQYLKGKFPTAAKDQRNHTQGESLECTE